LLNILPKPIAERLKRSSGMIADDYDRVAILFADIVGFTAMADRLPPGEVVDLLNDVFNAFDKLAENYRVEKIKTIGDAYMVVAGLPTAEDEPEEILARLALDLVRATEQFRTPGTGAPLQVRIGLNSGRVVAGVIGQRKFAYDLWGDAVNVAARLEATGEPGRIQLSESLADTLADRFTFEPRGEIEVKGKGLMRTCFLTGTRPAP
jgi:class 3 adenylate cyclase